MAYKKVINSRMVLASILKKVFTESFGILAEVPKMIKLFSCGQKVIHKKIRRPNGSAYLAEFKPQPLPQQKKMGSSNISSRTVRSLELKYHQNTAWCVGGIQPGVLVGAKGSWVEGYPQLHWKPVLYKTTPPSSKNLRILKVKLKQPTKPPINNATNEPDW